ncbi:MAG: hypothetical protein BWY78_00285 [Alphaproteobacteria bacterium ADurb.Bin438]|nr:MAG: hypothetical protein BWY78_00285 [Alphaproteobacteria bacterium ADurb.Bin438]
MVKIETAGNNGSLKAYASKDINLVQENGNLGISSVISAGGDVAINVKNGGVFDTNTNEVFDNNTKEALLKTWDDMNLNEISDENELNSLVATYENQKTRDYFDYFEIKSGLNADGIFEFNANQIDTLKSENPDVNIADLVAYKMQRYNELAKEYKNETYNQNYKYVASVSDKNSLKKGAGWSESQLSYSLNKAKLGEITDTKYMEEQANIAGRKVNLTVNGSVGRDMGSKVIDVSNPSLISEEDKLLLSAAESDNVKFSDDFKTATVYLREDLDIHANELTLSAKDYVYLGAEQDININKIETDLNKNITISGSNGVYNVANDKSAVNIIGNNLVIEAGNGGIGKLDARINLGLKDNAKITLRGVGDTYISSLNNLGVDYIYSKGLVDIKSLSNIFDARNDDKVNIRSNSLNLDVANLGEVSNLFDLVVNEFDIKSKNAYLNNAENHDLLIKKGDILNDFALLSQQGNINIDELKVGNHASLTSYEGDIDLGQINSQNGSISLTVENGNVEGKKGIKNIIAKLVDFVNVNGFIGKENNINIQANRVNAIALNDININLLNLDKLSKQSDFGNILSKEGDISLMALNDNLSLNGKIEALKGNVNLKAEEKIIDNVKDTSGTIRANIIDFMAKNGEVGDKDNYINIDSSILGNGYVNALSNKGIFVNEVAGDMMVGSFVSKTGDIDLRVDSSIIGYNFDDNRTNLKAKNITLHSNNGTIGNEDNILKLTVMDDGQGLINMESAYGIYALKTSPDLLSNYIKVMKDGDIVFYLPAGKAKIEKLVRKGKADFIFEDGGSDSDVWISALNLENILTESAISKNIMPADMNFDIVAPLRQIEEVTNNLGMESHGGKSKDAKKQKDDELYDLLVMNN